MRKFGFFAVTTSTVISLALSGCVVVGPITVFLQNPTNQPIYARLHYRKSNSTEEANHSGNREVFARGLRYSLKDIKPSRKAIRRLTDTLHVDATDTAAVFIIPPHATVLLINTYGQRHLTLPVDARLYLQPAGSITQVLDTESFRQAGRFQYGAFCYKIGFPVL